MSDEPGADEEHILMLDELTGLVHQYEGVVGPGGPHLCDCELVEYSYEAGTLVSIPRRAFEIGIWEPAECLRDDDPEDGNRSVSLADTDATVEDEDGNSRARMEELGK